MEKYLIILILINIVCFSKAFAVDCAEQLADLSQRIAPNLPTQDLSTFTARSVPENLPAAQTRVPHGFDTLASQMEIQEGHGFAANFYALTPNARNGFAAGRHQFTDTGSELQSVFIRNTTANATPTHEVILSISPERLRSNPELIALIANRAESTGALQMALARDPAALSAAEGRVVLRFTSTEGATDFARTINSDLIAQGLGGSNNISGRVAGSVQVNDGPVFIRQTVGETDAELIQRQLQNGAHATRPTISQRLPVLERVPAYRDLPEEMLETMADAHHRIRQDLTGSLRSLPTTITDLPQFSSELAIVRRALANEEGVFADYMVEFVGDVALKMRSLSTNPNIATETQQRLVQLLARGEIDPAIAEQVLRERVRSLGFVREQEISSFVEAETFLGYVADGTLIVDRAFDGLDHGVFTHLFDVDLADFALRRARANGSLTSETTTMELYRAIGRTSREQVNRNPAAQASAVVDEFDFGLDDSPGSAIPDNLWRDFFDNLSQDATEPSRFHQFVSRYTGMP